MRIFERIWTTVTCVLNWLTLSPFDGPGGRQYPISGNLNTGHNGLGQNDPVSGNTNLGSDISLAKGPVFKPPTGKPDSDFVCDYRNMPGWEPCSTANDRGCWLRNTVNGREYNITTDYENNGPIGILRNYTVVLNDGPMNADGIVFSEGKFFNNSYPGPWIQACWGDVSRSLSKEHCFELKLMHTTESEHHSHKQLEI